MIIQQGQLDIVWLMTQVLHKALQWVVLIQHWQLEALSPVVGGPVPAHSGPNTCAPTVGGVDPALSGEQTMGGGEPALGAIVQAGGSGVTEGPVQPRG